MNKRCKKVNMRHYFIPLIRFSPRLLSLKARHFYLFMRKEAFRSGLTENKAGYTALWLKSQIPRKKMKDFS